MKYRVAKWDKYQHYKDRCPPWIKLHFELLSSETWVTLDDAGRVLAVACMLLASRNGGEVPANPKYIQRVAYLSGPPDFRPLVDCGFLTIQADASTAQEDASTIQADDTTETETETEKINTSRPPAHPREADAPQPPTKRIRYDYEARTLTGIIPDDVSLWSESFPAVNVEIEIKQAAAWLDANPSKRKSNVYRFLTNWLKRAQERGGSIPSAPRTGLAPGQIHRQEEPLPAFVE